MSRHSRKHKSYKGGNYTSGSTYGSYVNGSGNEQFARTFDSTGPYGSRFGSQYIGAQGQMSQQYGTPNQQNLSLIQTAGKHKHKNKRNSFLARTLNKFIPLSLLGFKTHSNKKHYTKHKHNNTRKYYHTRRHRKY